MHKKYSLVRLILKNIIANECFSLLSNNPSRVGLFKSKPPHPLFKPHQKVSSLYWTSPYSLHYVPDQSNPQSFSVRHGPQVPQSTQAGPGGDTEWVRSSWTSVFPSVRWKSAWKHGEQKSRVSGYSSLETMALHPCLPSPRPFFGSSLLFARCP